MHAEQVDVEITKAVMDQAGDVVHQRLQLERGTDAFAHLGNQRQLIGATAEIVVKTRSLHGARNRIGERSQDEQVIGMEGIRFVALDVEHAQHPVPDLERQDHLCSRLG